jgi:transposase
LKNLFVPPLFLDILLLKNPMNLTDEQWRLIEPILPPPSPSERGRHPLRYPPGLLRDTARERGALPEMAR